VTVVTVVTVDGVETEMAMIAAEVVEIVVDEGVETEIAASVVTAVPARAIRSGMKPFALRHEKLLTRFSMATRMRSLSRI
jgi:hypothetical protein